MRGVRKLAFISIGYSFAIFAAHYILPTDRLYIAAAITAVSALFALIFKGRTRQIILLTVISAAVGLCAYRMHYDRTLLPCEELAGRKMYLDVEVLDYPTENERGLSLPVRPLNDDVPNVRMLLFDYGYELRDAAPGDSVSAVLKLSSADRIGGEENDSYISDGVYLRIYPGGAVELKHNNDRSLRYLPQRLGKALRDEIRSVFPENSHGLMLALMTGDKSEYYADDELYCSMSIAGLSHVAAVSGMHVSFILGFVQLVFGRSKRTSVLSLLFVWLFVLMSGASPSALRAGIMLSVLLLAPIFGRENDNITTLSLALLIILCVNPFAAGSLSLQLSFAAMAGIFTLTKPIFDYLDAHTPEIRHLRRLKLYINGAVSNSLAVTVFTLPLCAVHFGSIALLSPVSNVLCLWAISVLFAGGYAVCLIGLMFGKLAVFTAGILAYLVRYIALAVKLIAGLPFAQLYTKNVYAVLCIALCYVLFAMSRVFRDKSKRYSPVLPAVLSLTAIVSVFVWTDISMKNSGAAVNILDVGDGQCIAITQNEHTLVIDCGSSGTGENAGSALSSYLHSEGRGSIDCLIITHPHSDHAGGVTGLMGLADVAKLILPAPEDEETALYKSIIDAAAKHDIKTELVSSDEDFKIGDISVSLYAPYAEGDGNERGLMLTVSVGGKKMLVTGDVSQETERKLVKDKELSDTDILIVGHHGSRYSTCTELLNEASPETAVISVGYNSYGHPADEVLARLSDCGAEILRTDHSGNIKIICGD